MTGLQRLKAFAKSPHHAWLGLLTLGLGIATANPLLAIAGAAAYGLGWVYLPDSGIFNRWLRKKSDREQAESPEAKEKAQFLAQRDRTYNTLAHPLRTKYDALAALASEVEQGFRDNPAAAEFLSLDSQLRQLDSLMWTYLRLLHTEQALSEHLVRERRESLPERAREITAEIDALTTEIAGLDTSGSQSPLRDTRNHQLASRRARLDTLEKRIQKCAAAEANLDLAQSEQARVIGHVKLLAGEVRTARDAGDFSRHIDASASQLSQTNRWLADLADLGVEDSLAIMPQSTGRIGFSLSDHANATSQPAPAQAVTPRAISE